MEYSKFSVKDLKNILDKKGVKGCSKYKKDELISILSKLETIEQEDKEEFYIPSPPAIPSSIKEKEEKEINEYKEKESLPLPELFEKSEEEHVKEEEEEHVKEEEEELTSEDQAMEELKLEEKLNDERIKDPVKLFENFKPTLAISEDKKSDILKGMIQYKTAQKLMERQEIQREIDKARTEVAILRQEYMAMFELVKKDLKEVRESFMMSTLIILHNFSFLPLDKLPIFKKK
jgi:hypothetical protein